MKWRGNVFHGKFKAADSEILRFYPTDFYYYGYYSNNYDRRGAAFTSSNNITAWDALNFAGFWYDLDTGLYSETLKITNLSGRVIQEGSLDYTSRAVPLPYIAMQETGKIPDFTDGTYTAIGWVEISMQQSMKKPTCSQESYWSKEHPHTRKRL